MDNKATVTDEFYKSLSQELLGKFKRVANFTKHRPTIGAYNEAILRKTIREMLPNRFSVKTGFAYAGIGRCSKQLDILVVDENDPSAYFMQDGDFCIVHPRALVCAIEVKTTLRKRDFLEAFENFCELVECSKSVGTRWSAQGFIFAFESRSLTPYTLQGWYRSLKKVPDDSYMPAMIISMKSGALQLKRQTVAGENWGHYWMIGEEKKSVKSTALAIFLAHIKKLAELHAGIESNPFESVPLNGIMKLSQEFFRPGEGAKIPDSH